MTDSTVPARNGCSDGTTRQPQRSRPLPPGQPPLIATWVVATLFVWSMIQPTSRSAVVSKELTLVTLAIPCLAFAALVITGCRGTPLMFVNSGFILGLVLLFTLTSPFEEISWGVLGVVLSLAGLFVVDVRRIAADSAVLRAAHWLVTVAVLMAGAGVILGVQPIQAFLIDRYSAFYPDLVSMMVSDWKKPVFSFGTHSLAAFFYYLLFWTWFARFAESGKAIHLALACAFLGLEVPLRSTSAVFFGCVGAAQLVGAGRRCWWLTPVALGGLAALYLYASGVTAAPEELLRDAESAVLGTWESGLVGRYSAGGTLSGDLNYLLEGGWPVGMTYSPSLFFGDSGIVVYLLRGGPLLVLGIYWGLLLLLLTNLGKTKRAAGLFVAIIAFEVGFTPLLYWRFVAALPLLMTLLRVGKSTGGLDRERGRRA